MNNISPKRYDWFDFFKDLGKAAILPEIAPRNRKLAAALIDLEIELIRALINESNSQQRVLQNRRNHYGY